MKLDLHITVAHPKLPGEDRPPEIFVAVHRSPMEALTSASQASEELVRRRITNGGPEYVVETVTMPIEVHGFMAMIAGALRSLPSLGRAAMKLATLYQNLKGVPRV
jgi:hypothetical protein